MKGKTMIAYHGDAALKSRLLELIKWRDARMARCGVRHFTTCACNYEFNEVDTLDDLLYDLAMTLNIDFDDDGPNAFSKIVGVPSKFVKVWNGFSEDGVLPSPGPLQFFESIQVGADLSLAWHRFAVWLLIDEEHGVIRHMREYENWDSVNEFMSDGRGRSIINDVAQLHQNVVDGQLVKRKQWSNAASLVNGYRSEFKNHLDYYAHKIPKGVDYALHTATDSINNNDMSKSACSAYWNCGWDKPQYHHLRTQQAIKFLELIAQV